MVVFEAVEQAAEMALSVLVVLYKLICAAAREATFNTATSHARPNV